MQATPQKAPAPLKPDSLEPPGDDRRGDASVTSTAHEATSTQPRWSNEHADRRAIAMTVYYDQEGFHISRMQ